MREKLSDQGYDREEEYFRKKEREDLEKLREKNEEKKQDSDKANT